jgi:UDP-N-acetylmuramoyl-L-alanyl-D-glutamate--2,6-diaminopimelate ligase
MKNLKDILYRVGISEVLGSTDREIQSLCFDSRQAADGCAFIAVRGSTSDGHAFIETAVEKGAVAVICEELPAVVHEHVVYVVSTNSSEALGYMASNFLGNPSEEIQVIELIRRHHKSGKSLQKIADWLNEQGYTTKRGQTWKRISVKRVLDRLKKCDRN